MCKNCNDNKKEYSPEDLGQEFEFKFDHDIEILSKAIGVSAEQLQTAWGAVGMIFMSTTSPSRFLEELHKSKITRSELLVCLQQAIERWNN